MSGWWFFATPLKNDGVSSSVRMMTFPIIIWKNNPNVPNHQSDVILLGDDPTTIEIWV